MKRPSWGAYLDAYNTAKARYTKTYWDAQGRRAVAGVVPYEKQSATDPFILIVVVSMVLAGLLLSALQFLKGPMYARTLAKARTSGGAPQPGHGRPAERDDDEVDDAPVNDREPLKGVELRSGFIGLSLFTLSIAFFYLYLIYLHQIHPTR